MKSRKSKAKPDYTLGSENVYRDLGFADTDAMRVEIVVRPVARRRGRGELSVVFG